MRIRLSLFLVASLIAGSAWAQVSITPNAVSAPGVNITNDSVNVAPAPALIATPAHTASEPAAVPHKKSVKKPKQCKCQCKDHPHKAHPKKPAATVRQPAPMPHAQSGSVDMPGIHVTDEAVDMPGIHIDGNAVDMPGIHVDGDSVDMPGIHVGQ